MQKTLAVVNLRKLRNNALKIREIIKDTFFFAVVKANAYGHGAPQVARAIEDIVDGFCVAIVDEGVALRLAGIEKPVLVLTPLLDKDDALRAKFYSLEVTVGNGKSAALSSSLPCHIKVNTGMNRAGCNLSELPELLDRLNAQNIVGAYSHLYDPANKSARYAQLKLFEKAQKIIEKKAPDPLLHLAASGGVLAGGRYLKKGVRCGILLYGYAPAGFEFPVEPVLKVYAKRVQTTGFTGGGVGYAAALKNYKKLHTYRLGYADGFLRNIPLGEGKLCMDSFISQKSADLFPVLENAQGYAAQAGTISYEILCNATRRAEIIYEE